MTAASRPAGARQGRESVGVAKSGPDSAPIRRLPSRSGPGTYREARRPSRTRAQPGGSTRIAWPTHSTDATRGRSDAGGVGARPSDAIRFGDFNIGRVPAGLTGGGFDGRDGRVPIGAYRPRG